MTFCNMYTCVNFSSVNRQPTGRGEEKETHGGSGVNPQIGPLAAIHLQAHVIIVVNIVYRLPSLRTIDF